MTNDTDTDTDTDTETLARWTNIDRLHAEGLYYPQGPETLATIARREHLFSPAR